MDHDVEKEDIVSILRNKIKDAEIQHKQLREEYLKLQCRFQENEEQLNLMQIERKKIIAFEQDFMALCSLYIKKEMGDYDEYTAGHSSNVAKLSKVIANRVGLNWGRLSKLEFTALTHDVGKVKVAKKILTKQGKLTLNERREMQRHPIYGLDILNDYSSKFPIINSYINEAGVYFHHSRFNGGGYPDVTLKGWQIPLEARIIAVADTFDAISSDRPYRKGRSASEAMAVLLEVSGQQLDPNLVNILYDFYQELKEKHGTTAESFTTLYEASFGEEIRSAKIALKSYLSGMGLQYNRDNPLDKIKFKDAAIRIIKEKIRGTDMLDADLDNIVRYVCCQDYKHRLDDEVNEKSRAALVEKIRKQESNGTRRIRISVPVKNMIPYEGRKVITFNNQLWAFVADNHQEGQYLILMRKPDKNNGKK